VFRRSFVEQVFKDGLLTDKRNYYITFSFILITTTIAFLYDQVLDYIGFVGSFGCLFICHVFPVLVYVKGNSYPLFHWKNVVSLTILFILIIVETTSGVLVVINIINNIINPPKV
jgi:hypothetical protein